MVSAPKRIQGHPIRGKASRTTGSRPGEQNVPPVVGVAAAQQSSFEYCTGPPAGLLLPSLTSANNKNVGKSMKKTREGITEQLFSDKVCKVDFAAARAPVADEGGTVVDKDSALGRIARAVDRAREALMGRQHDDGHWIFELEADATIPAEYLFLRHFLGTTDDQRTADIARFLRGIQKADGAWPLYHEGAGDISATVKAYFALKFAGDAPDAPHMVKARAWVHAHGGAESVNVFTRIMLATFGQLPWRVVPAMPVEIVLLPHWWFFSLKKVSYWSRCVIVPLLIIFAHRPVVPVPKTAGVRELFHSDPEALTELDAFEAGRPVKNAFLLLDRLIKHVEPWMPGQVRRMALRRAERWTREHMQGPGGIGGIFPAMANAVMALRLLGAAPDDADFVRNVHAIEDLVVERGEETYCQPCVGPVWDTCLSLNALTEAGVPPSDPRVRAAVQWLFDRQIFVRGDWSENAPKLEPGGWAFQYENDKYPDVDDTGMVLMSLLRANAHEHEAPRKRMNQAVNWVLGMQNRDGSWGAFDIDNDYTYLNNIPFADHGALVDPGTADLTGRCIELFAMLGYDRNFKPARRGIEFLKRDQHPCGGWYGRWGVNYLYGTWSVLTALGAIGESRDAPYLRRAIEWLYSVQNEDGGWGESCDSYEDGQPFGVGDSTASQTSWALLALMAVGEVYSPNVQRGIEYLLASQNADGEWDETLYTGTGFPRVFYLRYHAYSKIFPLTALSTYRRICEQGESLQQNIIAQGAIDLGPIPELAAQGG